MTWLQQAREGGLECGRAGSDQNELVQGIMCSIACENPIHVADNMILKTQNHENFIILESVNGFAWNLK